MSILVFNAGSSSLKFGLFEASARDTLAWGTVDWAGDAKHAQLVVHVAGKPDIRQSLEVCDSRQAVAPILQALTEIDLLRFKPQASVTVVGHRVVHGGTRFRDSARIDARVKQSIAQLSELAPLHNPPALDAIAAAEAALPDTPQVAVFDTAYFASLPASAYVYPLPYEWYRDWGVRRYGFHGISHGYCAARAAEMLKQQPADLRLVICHLGNGCSATAVRGGQAIATTMGFTPLEGLMMGTRGGSVDPGALLYVQRQHGLSAEQLELALNRQSGLLGVSGVSSDFRQVEAAAIRGDERAKLALDMFADRVRSAVGALTVTLGGVDALVFTAGVGENSPQLRQAVCHGLGCVGLALDQVRNNSVQPDGDIAADESTGRILVIHAREDLRIAREALRLL